MQKGVSIASLRERVIRYGVRDSWWLAVDDQPMDRPLRLKSIETQLKEEPDREYCILHQDEADAGNADWQPLFLAPKLRMPKAEPGPSANDGDVAALKERVASLEAQQQSLLATVDELRTLLLQSLQQSAAAPSPITAASDDDVDDEGVLSFAEMTEQERQAVKMRQLREKIHHPGIKLVG